MRSRRDADAPVSAPWRGVESGAVSGLPLSTSGRGAGAPADQPRSRHGRDADSAPRILVLAGLDPSGGAGLVADGEAIRAAGGRALLCATAITIQTTARVRGFHPLPPEVIEAQALALAEEEGGIAAVKLGMLGSAAAAAVASRLLEHPALASLPWVIDPVLRSSSGAALIEGGAAAYAPLLRRGVILTPNVLEAAALVGRPEARDADELRRCAEALLEAGVEAVVATGGHLPDAPVDWVVSRSGAYRLEGARRGAGRRGTGCRFASFLAARLGAGEPLDAAAGRAKAWVAAYLEEG